jgi:hypothetical protein
MLRSISSILPSTRKVIQQTKQPITKKLNVPPETAWKAISRIGRLDIWFPFIATCLVEGSGVGACRKMTTSEGGEITDHSRNGFYNEATRLRESEIAFSGDILTRNGRGIRVV